MDVVLKEHGYPAAKTRLNIKHIAVSLAKQCFFGPNVMRVSTVGGHKPGMLPLDPEKLLELRQVIKHIMVNETDEDFEDMWMEVKLSIGKACHSLRQNRISHSAYINIWSILSSV